MHKYPALCYIFQKQYTISDTETATPNLSFHLYTPDLQSNKNMISLLSDIYKKDILYKKES